MGLGKHARTWVDMVPHVATLTALARGHRRALDLGMRGGVSAWALLDGIGPHGSVTSVDIDAAWLAEVPEHVLRDDRWRFVLADDRDPAAWRTFGMSDLVFIDTSHRLDHTLTELYGARALGAVTIALHDCMLPDVRDAIETFTAATEYVLDMVEPSDWGLAVLVRR